MKSQEQWPFDDPKNVAVITLKAIAKGGNPILHVTHDADDGAWQFLDGSTVSEESAAEILFSFIRSVAAAGLQGVQAAAFDDSQGVLRLGWNGLLSVRAIPGMP